MKVQKILKESAMTLRESTATADNSLARPELSAFTRAVNNLIYMDMVAVQPTSQPIAALFGLRYKNPEGDMSYTTAATYGGKYGSRENIPEASLKSYSSGDVFQYEKIVYEVCTDFSLADLASGVYDAAMRGDIRMASEAADTEKFENNDSAIEDIDFTLDKWTATVKSRKLKTAITVEAAQDLENNGAMAENVIDDFLATMISEEVNKDIIQKLITVSKRFKVAGMSETGIYTISQEEYADPLLGYKLIRILNEMAAISARTTGFSPTYVLATSRVAGVLSSTGLEPSEIESSSGVLKQAGLDLFVDTTTPFDYIIVGIKLQSPTREERMETVGSLVYSPYEEVDEGGTIKFVVDPDSLQPSLAVMVRYALSVNPYIVSKQDEIDKKRIVCGDDWKNLAGRSYMSMFLGVKLPEFINADED